MDEMKGLRQVKTYSRPRSYGKKTDGALNRKRCDSSHRTARSKKICRTIMDGGSRVGTFSYLPRSVALQVKLGAQAIFVRFPEMEKRWRYRYGKSRGSWCSVSLHQCLDRIVG